MKVLAGIGLAVVAMFFIVLLSAVMAYPTKWIVNYLFSPTFLFTLFGVAKLNFWRALALNFITASFFKGSVTTKS